ncbi:MAG: FtsX-like permease family protein [Nitrospirota bacterium]|nr:MAG: FtsX-like permease family protein [Nitrospirota bacterium]
MLKAIFLLVTEHIRQRPIRSVLAIVGVAIGVSAWLAIRLANVEVYRAFEESVDTVVGKASIQVTGENGRLDEQILPTIRTNPAVTAANPVLRIPGTGYDENSQKKPIMILGLDLLEYWSNEPMVVSGQERTRINLNDLIAENSVFIGNTFAADWKITVGDSLEVEVDHRRFHLVVRGILTPSQSRNRQFDHLVVMDIAAAQSLFGLEGRLDQINLILGPDYSVQEVMQELHALLPANINVGRPIQRNQQVESMLKVFQFNLTVLSTVGLLVGLFLVYNTISFSVVQHRREIGILRTVGMSRTQVSLLFMTEAAVVGLIGSVVGCGLGFMMARLMVSLVSQSVTDLYASVTIGSMSLPLAMIFEGSVLGLGVALVGALRPCLNASGTQPVRALAPGDYETETRTKEGFWAWGAGVLFLLAGLMSVPGPVQGIPVFGYGSALFLLLGCTLLGPIAIRGLTRVKMWALGSRLPIMGTLAVEQIARAPGRNSVTLSALTIGLAIMVGVGSMIGSFRHTVEVWIDQTIIADLIVAPNSWMDGSDSDEITGALPLEFVPLVQAVPGVMAVDPYRQVQVAHEEGTIVLATRNLNLHATHSRYLFEEGDSSEILRRAVAEKGVIVSEVLAGRLGLTVGDHLELAMREGTISFPVLGKFYDYATDGGKVVMDETVYHQFWNDRQASVLAVYIEPQEDSGEVRRRIEEVLLKRKPVVTISQAELRTDILDIFDRTFRVTYVLEFIALSVALLGIVNTLVTAILERQREIATLRAIGASVRQIQRMVFWESGFLAFLGALLGLAGGSALSVLLVKVINRQSFGWTIQLMIPPMTVLEAVCVAGVAGILASYLPARWASQQSIVNGLRYE